MPSALLASPIGEVNELAALVRRLADAWPDETAPMAALAAGSELGTALDRALRAAVSRARTYGKTWAEIGDVFGTSRQAAFQRFGRPADPFAAAPVELADATGRAVAVVVAFLEGRFEEVRASFDDVLTARLDVARLEEVRAGLALEVGAYERMGAPFARRFRSYLVVDVPLHFEAGARTGQVALDAGRRVAGFFLLASGEERRR